MYREHTKVVQIGDRVIGGKNPILIIVPCHRVIGSNGQLTGFGWGIPLKKRLLTLEKNILSTRAKG